MLSAFRRVVSHPASFFDEESRDPGLLQPAAVVTAIAVVGLLGAVPTFLALAEATPEGAGILVIGSLAVGSVVGAMGPFVSWLIVAGLLFVGSVVFGGEGEFRDTFALVGWGFAPRILVPAVATVISFVVVSGTDFSDPQQARQLTQMGATGTLTLVNQAVNAVTFLWAGWIWTHALASARSISVRNAGVVVGALVALQILLNVGLALLGASLAAGAV